MLRLAGSPGVGKSAVGWAVAERIAAGGRPVAYVDIDQLGICYPATQDDPDRWELKERALVRLADQYRQAGVAQLIVSGVASPDLPPPAHPGVSTRSLWLDADADVRRARLRPRGWASEYADEVVRIGTEEAARLDNSWERLSTNELTVAETVHAVVSRWALETPHTIRFLRNGAEGDSAAEPPVEGTRKVGHVLWITGPRCVGASTAGWLIAADDWQQGRRTGFIDIAQLSFSWNNDVPIGLTNGVALQETFAATGVEGFVIVAPLDIEPAQVRVAFAGAKVSVVRLDATDAELFDRALARTHGEGPLLSGDDLLGASTAEAEALIASAISRQRIAARPGEVLIDTSDSDVLASKAKVIAAAEW